jgi:type IV secretion system protein VirD4
MIRHLPLLFAALLAALLALAFARWAFLPAKYVPRFRIRTMQLRVILRLHPGRGFASLPELWWNWGRWAAYRESGRTRPTLTRRQRIVRPSSHAVYLGRAHCRHRLWVTIQECILLVGRSRSGKSGFLGKVIIRFRGAKLSATTKPDLFRRTSRVAARLGRPVWKFDPQRIDGPASFSNARWDPIPGCQDPTTAMRRGTAWTDAVRTKGTESGDFWSDQAAVQMPALFSAAALAGLNILAPYHWIMSGDTRPAERILRAHGRGTWASTVGQMRGAADDKTAATIKRVLVSALRFLEDPRIAECLLPAPGEGFRIEEFLLAEGSLYLMADPRGESSPVAPVFSCFVNEIHWTACQMAAAERGERLDPPLLLLLDEVAKLCPGLPVPSLLADSGGRGITMVIACQGLAQLEEVWGRPAVRSILDTTNQLYLRGIQDPDTLKMASDLCDVATYRARGKAGETADYPVATQGMISRLPKRRAMVMRGGLAPVIAHLPMVWNDWRYRLARLTGGTVADLTVAKPVPASVPAIATTASVLVPADDQAPAELAGVSSAAAVNGHAAAGGWSPAVRQALGARYPWDKR